jgi:hypothetical protein
MTPDQLILALGFAVCIALALAIACAPARVGSGQSAVASRRHRVTGRHVVRACPCPEDCRRSQEDAGAPPAA